VVEEVPEAPSEASPAAPPPSRSARWLAAIKPPLYSVALVPLCVGFAAAYASTGAFAGGRFGMLLAGSCLVILWLNLSNDAWDAGTGVDVRKWESVVNLVGNRAVVGVVAFAALAAGCGLLLRECAACADPRVVWMLGLAIVCGHVYQAPPFRLSYKGLGEPLCFLAFGPLATSAFYLLALGPGAAPSAALPLGIGIASVLIGITTSVILFCSHMHQVKDDLAAGKLSPVARLGEARAAALLPVPLAATYTVAAIGVVAGALPLAAGLCAAVSAPLAHKLRVFVASRHHVPDLVRAAKFHAVRWHAAHGALLALGFVASRAFNLP